MKDLFIHKPLGVVIDIKTRELLKKKYNGFWEFCERKASVEDPIKFTWYVPDKITSYKDFENEMKSENSIFTEQCESIIHMSATNHPKTKASSIYIKGDSREKHPNNWVMGLFPLTIENLFKDTIGGIKYDAENSSVKFLNDFVLSELSNASILNIIRTLYSEYNLESVIISNGIINKFLNAEYEENGVFYSNLSFENNLPDEKVTKIATLLTWIRSQGEKNLDISETFAKLVLTPHKILMRLVKEHKAEEFVEKL